jgi:hypothetical protein
MFPILADVVWPALFVENRLLSMWVILAGLVVEYFFVRRITRLSVKKSILADVSMNAASTLLGIVLIPVAGLAWEVFPGIILFKWFNLGTFNPGTWLATFCFAVLINAALETFVLAKLFKQQLGKRGFRWLCLANAVSVGIAYASFFIFPIKS